MGYLKQNQLYLSDFLADHRCEVRRRDNKFAMFGITCASSVLLLLSLYSTTQAEDNALRDNENKYLFDRLLLNLRSSANRQGALNELIRNYVPEDYSARNKNILLEVLANLGDVPFDFGGPADDLTASGNPDIWSDMPDIESTANRVNIQLEDLSKRWGSGPGPRGKRFDTEVNSRVRRRDGPGPRGKRQGPRGKKQGPRGKKEDDENVCKYFVFLLVYFHLRTQNECQDLYGFLKPYQNVLVGQQILLI